MSAARELDAANAVPCEHLLGVIHGYEIDEQIRGEIAARDNHVAREVANPHRLADRSVYYLVGVASGGHTKRRAIDQAEESIPHVQAGIERETSGIDRAEQCEQNRNLDGARGVKPAIAAL